MTPAKNNFRFLGRFLIWTTSRKLETAKTWRRLNETRLKTRLAWHFNSYVLDEKNNRKSNGSPSNTYQFDKEWHRTRISKVDGNPNYICVAEKRCIETLHRNVADVGYSFYYNFKCINQLVTLAINCYFILTWNVLPALWVTPTWWDSQFWALLTTTDAFAWHREEKVGSETRQVIVPCNVRSHTAKSN